MSDLNNFPFKIYCDMDGVLVDFVSGAVDKINDVLLDPPQDLDGLAIQARKELGRNHVLASDLYKNSPTASKQSIKFMYRLLERDEEFWANLPWTIDGRALWAYLSQYNPTLLTSPMDKGGYLDSIAGKKRWAQTNLDGLDTNSRMIFAHDKFEHAIDDDGRPCVLIDDFLHKVAPFRERGGFGVHHTGDVYQTIQRLEEIKNGSRSI
jgi:hypothetical protein